MKVVAVKVVAYGKVQIKYCSVLNIWIKLSTLDVHKKLLSDYEVLENRRSERHTLLKKLIELPSMLDEICYKRPACNHGMLLSVGEFLYVSAGMAVLLVWSSVNGRSRVYRASL